jgi:hypothetical protein
VEIPASSFSSSASSSSFSSFSSGSHLSAPLSGSLAVTLEAAAPHASTLRQASAVAPESAAADCTEAFALLQEATVYEKEKADWEEKLHSRSLRTRTIPLYK